MRIGIIKEGKVPSDSRVALTPAQCKHINDNTDHEVIIQSSEVRIFKDEEYSDLGLQVQNNLEDIDIYLGVKEVPIEQLHENKVYFFFSHTIKEQAYNRKLLRSILKKNIHLIDYEVLTDGDGKRLIAFGEFAGMVGAHNAIYAYGKKMNAYTLKRMKNFHDYKEAKKSYKKLSLPNIKIILTGYGRVGEGSVRVLEDMNIRRVSPEDFLNNTYDEAVYTQLGISDYYEKESGEEFNKKHFFDHPEEYQSIFAPYTEVADVFIQGIYWDPDSDQFFSKEDMMEEDFNIKVIADITCDIAPDSSIPSTIRPSTISQPVYGYNPIAQAEARPYDEKRNIDVMAIDNLPNELPRDASKQFGKMFIDHILPELSQLDESKMIERATIAKDGELGPHFKYLEKFVNSEE